MRNRRSKNTGSPETITGIAEATAERVRLGGELLQVLAKAVADNEKAQRRFRTAVLIRLSKIETMVQMIHGGQIAELHRSKPGSEEKIDEHTKAAEEFISKHSDELGLKMVKYIYGGAEALDQEPKEPQEGSS